MPPIKDNMSIKIYRAVYQRADNSFFHRSNLGFHRWVKAEDMQLIRDEIRIIEGDGEPPTIIGWEEMELEADEA